MTHKVIMMFSLTQLQVRAKVIPATTNVSVTLLTTKTTTTTTTTTKSEAEANILSINKLIKKDAD